MNIFSLLFIYYLVRNSFTGKLFALKQIPKIQDKKITLQAFRERDILSKINSPFIPKLYASFESEFFLFFLIEYAPGGELFYLLKKQKIFEESLTKFIFAQIVLIFEYLHSLNILYRDLKVVFII